MCSNLPTDVVNDNAMAENSGAFAKARYFFETNKAGST